MENERHLLAKRLAMEMLISKRYAMIAANEHRARQGYAQAYGEESFTGLAEDFSQILETL